jgi:hypothetical protein
MKAHQHAAPQQHHRSSNDDTAPAFSICCRTLTTSIGLVTSAAVAGLTLEAMNPFK